MRRERQLRRRQVTELKNYELPVTRAFGELNLAKASRALCVAVLALVITDTMPTSGWTHVDTRWVPRSNNCLQKKMLTSPRPCWQFVNIVNKFRTPLLLLCVFADVFSHGEIRNEDLVSVLNSIDGLTSESIAIRARDKQHHCRRLGTQATSGKHFCRQFAYFGQSTFATSKA